MMTNQIVPEIEIHEKYNYEQRQTRNFAFKAGIKLRANNRKSNRCRKTQAIKFICPQTYPPIFVTRLIKTFL
jgi:hypothetical protein